MTQTHAGVGEIERRVLRGRGVEIGPGERPIPGIRPYYVDCFTEFGLKPSLADYYGHSSLLPFRDNSLDYVASSHVLEHSANPVQALAEWHRVVKPGGHIYLVVPDCRFTWDHPRQPTTVEHFLDDYRRGTTACDVTHIDDFAENVDWSTFSPATPPEKRADEQRSMKAGMHAAVARGEEVNIHFHCFTPENVLGLLETLSVRGAVGLFDWEVVEQAERYPADNPIGFLAVLRVRKGLRDQLHAKVNAVRTALDRDFPLRPSALTFEAFRQQCAGKNIGGTLAVGGDAPPR